MFNLQEKLIVVFIWALSLLLVGSWQHFATTKNVNNAWKATMSANSEKIRDLEEKNRASEQQYSRSLNDAITKYEVELQKAADQHRRDVAAIRSGVIRLRDYSATCMQASGNQTSAVASSSSKGNGSSGAELSRKTSEDLFSLADDADATVRQLTACQEILTATRKAVSQ